MCVKGAGEMQLEKRPLIFDGGMGTEKLKGKTRAQIHAEYAAAGADVMTADTFGLYPHKNENFREEIRAAVEDARDAGKPVALDICPTGLLLEPYGTVTEDECLEIFRASVAAGVECGVDLILCETFMDIAELRLALTAACESGLPVIASMSFAQGGRTSFGVSVEDLADLADEFPLYAIGMNCGFGPDSYETLVPRLLEATKLPVLLQPNAGLPNAEGDYNLPAAPFAAQMKKHHALGVALLGGCCGTTPAHIAALA
jgi:5-methyltetrahydrofolate--homocysteine methyltransferase